MTREQAIKRAQKLWGTRARVSAGTELSSPEKRATAMEELRAARARRDAIDKEVQERLQAMDWYQTLMAERRKLLEVLKNNGRGSYYKFTVGKDMGMFFHVEGQGDTWEEAFARAESKQVKR